jgi:hypothetical protein
MDGRLVWMDHPNKESAAGRCVFNEKETPLTRSVRGGLIKKVSL